MQLKEYLNLNLSLKDPLQSPYLVMGSQPVWLQTKKSVFHCTDNSREDHSRFQQQVFRNQTVK